MGTQPGRVSAPSVARRHAGLLAIGVIFAVEARAATEAELVRAYLQGDTASIAVDAERARLRARGTRPPLFPNPSIDARREDARGPAGARTTALGASFSLDLGFTAAGEAKAAMARRAGAVHALRQTVVAQACHVRRDLLHYWRADRRAAAVARSQSRLDELSDRLRAHAAAGEVSGYVRDRARLAAAAHQVEMWAARADKQVAAAHVVSWIGAEPEDLQLEPLPPDERAAALRDAALGDHPELAALTFEVEATRRAETAAKRLAWPDLQLHGGTRWDAPPGAVGAAQQGYEAGGELELPFWDWSRARTREAKAARLTAEATLARHRTEIAAELDGAWRRVQLASGAMEELDGERIWVSAVSRYEAGEATIEELLIVAEDAEGAQLAYAERAHLLRSAHLDLACAAGAFAEPSIQRVVEDILR